MEIAVCDDEAVFRTYLRELLLRESFARGLDIHVTEYTSGEELLAACCETAFHADILFLDIRMQGLDGLEAARLLREKGVSSLVILLTSLAEYAMKGYEVRAFRYLLKEEMEGSLGRVMEECVDELGSEGYFSFTCEYSNHSICKRDILYFESRKRLVVLHTLEESYSFYQKLDALEEQLAGDGFLRCHKSFLVQERYVRSWRESRLWMKDGTELPISRSYEKEVNRRLMLRKG